MRGYFFASIVPYLYYGLLDGYKRTWCFISGNGTLLGDDKCATGLGVSTLKHLHYNTSPLFTNPFSLIELCMEHSCMDKQLCGTKWLLNQIQKILMVQSQDCK